MFHGEIYSNALKEQRDGAELGVIVFDISSLIFPRLASCLKHREFHPENLILYSRPRNGAFHEKEGTRNAREILFNGAEVPFPEGAQPFQVVQVIRNRLRKSSIGHSLGCFRSP